MNDSILRQIETEEIIFICENQYSENKREEYISAFRSLKERGIIRSEYTDNMWTTYSGVKRFILDFNFNKTQYDSHIGAKFGISYQKMIDMMKCFTIYNCGEFVFSTIQLYLNAIKSFLTMFKDKAFIVDESGMLAIQEFLVFIGTESKEIEKMVLQIPVRNSKRPKQRELAHLINYMAIENEITDLYDDDISDEDFIRWFPIYFWTKVTFILPLRATEMLITPYHCIKYRNGDCYLQIRRTKLKKRQTHVYYNVDQDYKIFEYKVPRTKAIENIEKYISLTSSQDRKYLFTYSDLMTNKLLSLQAFNNLLETFIRTYLIGNKKYDYTRYASGIKEFEVVTAGDSRPIAMANLFYQDMGAEICRQLADHTSINVSYGYFSNVSETILSSAIISLQRNINRGYKDMNLFEKLYSEHRLAKLDSFCTAPSNPLLSGDISECIKQDSLDDCLGCQYYVPSENELKNALEKRKKILDDASKNVISGMMAGTKVDVSDFEKYFLDAHSGSIRYKIACNELAKLEEVKWQRHRNSQTNC